MPSALRNVRSQGQSGKHVLIASFSGFDPERTSRLEIGFSQILAGHSFANEQPAKAKKPRKVAADQEMLLPISGKRTTKQVVKKANKRAAARSRKWA